MIPVQKIRMYNDGLSKIIMIIYRFDSMLGETQYHFIQYLISKTMSSLSATNCLLGNIIHTYFQLRRLFVHYFLYKNNRNFSTRPISANKIVPDITLRILRRTILPYSINLVQDIILGCLGGVCLLLAVIIHIIYRLPSNNNLDGDN